MLVRVFDWASGSTASQHGHLSRTSCQKHSRSLTPEAGKQEEGSSHQAGLALPLDQGLQDDGFSDARGGLVRIGFQGAAREGRQAPRGPRHADVHIQCAPRRRAQRVELLAQGGFF